METSHSLHLGDARDMASIEDGSVQLVVTSPPYPMIQMWDEVFAALSPESGQYLQEGRPWAAFEAQHRVLDAVWAECRRVLSPGGFLCVNIGDATRTLEGEFCLYPNQARIVTAMVRQALTPLPNILWRKPSNAPNKFMGSGMLPAGAYVTYEHEYILVFRRGGKRAFSAEKGEKRRESAYFWEERNQWFSDLWSDIRGTGQRLGADGGTRERSAAFPFELPYRLVNMFSIYGDTVLDPFAGTGTTLAAALTAGRSSVGYERVEALRPLIEDSLDAAVKEGPRRAQARLAAHEVFVKAREEAGKIPGHTSAAYGFPVTTGQEVDLRFYAPSTLRRDGNVATVGYVSAPWASPVRTTPSHDEDAAEVSPANAPGSPPDEAAVPSPRDAARRDPPHDRQLSLLGLRPGK